MKIQKREAPLKTKFFLSMCSLTTSVTVLLLIIMSSYFLRPFFLCTGGILRPAAERSEQAAEFLSGLPGQLFQNDDQ